jgi:hypothetical protein
LASSTATTTIDLEIATSSLATSTAISTFINKAQLKSQSASDLLTKGNSKLETKDYGEAFIFFKDAEKAAIEARLILERGDNLVAPSFSADVSTSTATTSTDLSVL